ncbi:MAG: type 1 glutamine amidotransferase [Amylibacter sp.]|nr:type 1 glutamine amidotransferase [Amylibacter sp.]
MKIGILQTGMAPLEMVERHGEYPDMFKRFLGGHGFDFETYNVLVDEFPDNAKDADGWLITGSKHGAYEDHPWIAPLENLVRQVYAADIPLVGVCFGHQIIAQALGGTVVKFDGGWSVGHTQYKMNGHDTPVMLNAWHQDQVVDLPKDARVIGSSDFCKYAALTYGDKVITVQPHPEFDDGFVKDLIKYRAPGVVPKGLLEKATARMGLANQNEMIADMFANILKQPKS